MPDIKQRRHEAYPSRADMPSCASHSCPRRLVWSSRLALIVVWVGRRSLVVDEILAFVWRGNLPEPIVPVKVEAIREIVSPGICISQRGQMVDLLDELQDATEVMGHVRDITLLCERSDHNQWNTET